MRADALTAGAAPVAIPRPKRRREVRDPYDGLRPWSAITHGVGAVLAAVGTISLLIQAGQMGNLSLMILFAIYGLSMLCLYTASTLYHCLRTSVKGRIALRKYDHCSIYLLIAGSYTPLCLTALRDSGGYRCSLPFGPWPLPGWCSPSPSCPFPGGLPAPFTSLWAGW